MSPRKQKLMLYIYYKLVMGALMIATAYLLHEGTFNEFLIDMVIWTSAFLANGYLVYWLIAIEDIPKTWIILVHSLSFTLGWTILSLGLLAGLGFLLISLSIV